jgi:hypothetical protein
MTRLRAPAGERGASAVEMAIVLPLFILLIFGIIEFGLLMRDQLTASNVAREYARIASVKPAEELSGLPAEMKDRAAELGLISEKVTTSIQYYDTEDSTWYAVDESVPSGAEIRTRVVYDHPLITQIIFPSKASMVLTGTVTMRRE